MNRPAEPGAGLYRSVFDGYRESPEFHDWTDWATAEDEARTFRSLGCRNVRIQRRRPDGWPYCPRCDEDELYSLAEPATVETICGCYRCGPWPITGPGAGSLAAVQDAEPVTKSPSSSARDAQAPPLPRPSETQLS